MSGDDFGAMCELLYGNEGEALQGCELSDAEARRWVQQAFPHKPYCLVRSWRWLDVDEIPAGELQAILGSGRQPAIVYADSVVLDSTRRFDVGDWVRTSWLLSYTEGGLFETANTVYVLLGSGTRKRAAMRTAFSFF